MARKPNYNFERRERERAKAAKKAAKAAKKSGLSDETDTVAERLDPRNRGLRPESD